VIRLRGKTAGREFVREIPVDFSAQPQHDVLATLWARTRVDDLMSQDFKGAQWGTMKEDVKQSIIKLGLDYRLMTQFTSFVAVEEMIVTDGGQPRRVDVPIEVPEGVNRSAVFGKDEERSISANFANPMVMNQSMVVTTRSAEKAKAPRRGSGGSGGSGQGVGGATPPPPKANVIAIDGLSDVDSRPLTPEQKQRADLLSRFHPSVLAVIDRLKGKTLAAPDESKFVRNGKAEVQIWFTDKSDEAMAKLKELGFEIILDPKTAKMVIGRLPIEKLALLAELKTIRYEAPQVLR
jgi:hypothetical protein